MPVAQFPNLSPAPILHAFEDYAGTFTDLELNQTLDGGELRSLRDDLIRQLGSLGVMAGDRIVFSIGNGPAFMAGLATILALDASPLLVHFKTPAPELKRTALRFGARWVLVDEPGITDLQDEFGPFSVIQTSLGNELRVSHIEPSSTATEVDITALSAVPMHPTSGTTGQPKIALRPGFAALEEARHYVETIGITAHDSILAVAPMSHAYAYGMCTMVPLFSGASIISMRGFQAPLVLQAFDERRVTIFPAVPAMLDVLLFGAGDRLKNCVRTVLSAGSPLSERTATRFREKSGITVRPLYGTTETGGITVAPGMGELTIGSNVGPPMPGVEAELRDVGAENDSHPGIGRLHIRSSSMMAGYLDGNEVDSLRLPGGWFETGDLARIDAQGCIHLTGREADVINVEGLKVLPLEVEEVIAAFPGIREVKVYAGRRKSGGQFIKAAVVGESNVDPAAIRAHCERSLVYFKRPERIIPLQALPRSPAGKILRDQLP